MWFYATMAMLALLTPAFAVIKTRRSMSAPGLLVTPMPVPWAYLGPMPEEIRIFVSQHDLDQTHALQFQAVRFALYPLKGEGPPWRWLVILCAGGKFIVEFCTEFGVQDSLTTSRATAGFSLPRAATRHLQSFPKATLDELLRRHLEAEEWLLKQNRVTLGPIEADAILRNEQSLRRQADFLKTRPFYWLSAIYLFWVGRHFRANRPIAQ